MTGIDETPSSAAASPAVSTTDRRVLGIAVHLQNWAFARTISAWVVFVAGHGVLVAWDWVRIHIGATPPFGMNCLDGRTAPLYVLLGLALYVDSRPFRKLWGAVLRIFFVGGQLVVALCGGFVFSAVMMDVGPYAGSACHLGDI